jgi:hypothetical protein
MQPFNYIYKSNAWMCNIWCLYGIEEEVYVVINFLEE